tara:strand:+ start:178 stop:738 length:561 start_codon:yes stop_codon:yes gene_type:complete
MAEFSGRVVNAQYMNAEYSIIKVSYEGDDGQLYVYHLDVDAGHQDYKDLLAEGWDVEKLVDATAESKRTQAAAFNTEVNAAAKILVDEILASEKEMLASEKEMLVNTKKDLADLSRSTRLSVQDMLAEVWTHILDKNTDKDMLFKFKLWVLEQDFVKEISKEQKSAIRKATRATQMFGLIDKLLED